MEYIVFYNVPDPKRYGTESHIRYESLVENLIKESLSNNDGMIVEIGCGKGALRKCHPNYIGCDISYYALKNYFDTEMRVQTDAQFLPFKDNSISFIFSISAIEHVPHPEHCFEEIHRVLKPWGTALLAPSWFCRPWMAKGLHIKPFNKLDWKDKIIKSLIPLRNSLLYRLIMTVPVRFLREVSYVINQRPMNFKYRKLNPNLNEHICPDSDAFSLMDSHMAALFYLSRGYKIKNKSGFINRLFLRHEPVIIQKPLE